MNDLAFKWCADSEVQRFYHDVTGDPELDTRIWYESEGGSWCWYVSYKGNAAEGTVSAGEYGDDANEPEGLERAKAMVIASLAALREYGHP